MSFLSRGLAVIVAAELVVIGWLAFQRATRPVAPELNLQRLDSATAADFEELRRRATEGARPEDWQALAEACMAYGFYPQAERCYQHLDRRLDHLSEPVYAVYGRAFCLERMGRMEDAIVQFRRAAELADPNLLRACWYHIGRNYLCLESADEAEAAFRKVAEFPPATYQLAKLLVRSQRAEQALPYLDRLDEAVPHELVVLLLRAEAARQLGDEAEALRMSDEAERASHQLPLNDGPQLLNPMFVRHGMARDLYKCAAYGRAGSPEAETDCIYAVYREHPEQWWYLRKAVLQTVETEIQLGRADQALATLEKIFEFTNVTARGVELAGDAWLLKADPERASESWKRSVRIQSSESAHRKLAEYYRLTDRMLLSSRHAAFAKFEAGCQQYRNDLLTEAAVSFAESVELDEEMPGSWFYLGECHRLLGDVDKARAAYERCLELKSNFGRALDRLERLTSPAESNAGTAQSSRVPAKTARHGVAFSSSSG